MANVDTVGTLARLPSIIAGADNDVLPICMLIGALYVIMVTSGDVTGGERNSES